MKHLRKTEKPIPFVRVILLVSLILALAPSQFGRAAEPPFRVMLPLIIRPPLTVSGHLYAWGHPVAGKQMELMQNDLYYVCSAKPYPYMTDETGYFELHYRPDIPPGTTCRLQFADFGINPPDGSLLAWTSPPLYPYPDPLSPHPLDVNVEDILPISPPHLSQVHFPVTFTWRKVTGFPDANYQLKITYGTPGDYYSPPLGDVDHYTINSLPGITLNSPYYWQLDVYGSDGSYGAGRIRFFIYFLDDGTTGPSFLSPDLRPNGLSLMKYVSRWGQP